MRFEILGPIAARRGDEEVTPRGVQQRRLLAALLMVAPEPIGVEVLADLLWPAGAPSANALQAQVSKLRRVVDPVAIRSTGRGCALDVPRDRVDVQAVEATVARGTALLDHDPATAAEVLVDARLAADRPDEAAALVEALLAERRAISACDAWCPTPLVTRAGSSVLPW